MRNGIQNRGDFPEARIKGSIFITPSYTQQRVPENADDNAPYWRTANRNDKVCPPSSSRMDITKYLHRINAREGHPWSGREWKLVTDTAEQDEVISGKE